MAAQPIELILARNLVSGISLAAFIVDAEGVVVFYNEAAGALAGKRFEEIGPQGRDQWGEQFGPFDEFGKLIDTESLPITVALRDGLPAIGTFHVRPTSGELMEVEVSALPLANVEGFQGALIAFWPVKA